MIKGSFRLLISSTAACLPTSVFTRGFIRQKAHDQALVRKSTHSGHIHDFANCAAFADWRLCRQSDREVRINPKECQRFRILSVGWYVRSSLPPPPPRSRSIRCAVRRSRADRLLGVTFFYAL